jgi:micrococcal nuclease
VVTLVLGLCGIVGCVAKGHDRDQQFLRVERVIDGDTLLLAHIGRVRLIGVDTPESVDPRRPVQKFALEAAAFLRQKVGGRDVRLEYDVERYDRYKRTLAYVFLPDGTFVNEEIIREGYGFAYTNFPFRYVDRFRALEKEARELRRGLWAE